MQALRHRARTLTTPIGITTSAFCGAGAFNGCTARPDRRAVAPTFLSQARNGLSQIIVLDTGQPAATYAQAGTDEWCRPARCQWDERNRSMFLPAMVDAGLAARPMSRTESNSVSGRGLNEIHAALIIRRSETGYVANHLPSVQ